MSITPEADQIQRDMLAYFNEHVNQFPPEMIIGFSPVGLMPNSAGHPNRERAIELLQTDIANARKFHLPEDLIAYALKKALECRAIDYEGTPGAVIKLEDLNFG